MSSPGRLMDEPKRLHGGRLANRVFCILDASTVESVQPSMAGHDGLSESRRPEDVMESAVTCSSGVGSMPKMVV